MIHGADVRKAYARGVWYASPYIYDSRKWAVYSPTGVCVQVCNSKREAVVECLRRANVEKVKLEVYVQGGVIQDITGPGATPLQSFVEVTVFDLDIDGAEGDRLGFTPNGDSAVVSKWEG